MLKRNKAFSAIIKSIINYFLDQRWISERGTFKNTGQKAKIDYSSSLPRCQLPKKHSLKHPLVYLQSQFSVVKGSDTVPPYSDLIISYVRYKISVKIWRNLHGKGKFQVQGLMRRRSESSSFLNPRLVLKIVKDLFVFQGQKGERGSSGNNAGGVIKFSDTAEKCTSSIAGTVSYSTSQKSLQLCDGSHWLPVLAVRKGYTADRPGRHCLDILNSGKLKLW